MYPLVKILPFKEKLNFSFAAQKSHMVERYTSLYKWEWNYIYSKKTLEHLPNPISFIGWVICNKKNSPECSLVDTTPDRMSACS